MATKQTVARIDRFLGINEADTSQTELRTGEAGYIRNFQITDGGNLSVRSGFARAAMQKPQIEGLDTAQITGMWTGYLQSVPFLILVYGGIGGGTSSALAVYRMQDGGFVCEAHQTVAEDTRSTPNLIFYYNKKVYALLGPKTALCVEEGAQKPVISDAELYAPLVITAAAPSGGGTSLEGLNLLTDRFREEFSADGEAKAYVLPKDTASVVVVRVNNTVTNNPASVGSYDAATHTFTFSTAPSKGVNNVEFTCRSGSAALETGRKKLWAMAYTEAYNGSTDTRVFFYGDGTNVCLYSDVPSQGTGLYVPAMNEAAVDFSDAPITGMIKYYSSLMVFKPDGTALISYEPVTLADGSVIAGFYIRSVSRNLGNLAPGQVQLVGNYPRTVFENELFEWRGSSTYYQDERNAKRISERVSKSLRTADPKKIVSCDDNASGTYYLFLNDDSGTILVHRYAQDVWTVYESSLAKNVKWAKLCGGTMLFATHTDVFRLTEGAVFDDPVTEGGERQQIRAIWESGFMHFGADYLRKYASDIWISVLPESSSMLSVTAATDRRDEYAQKEISTNILSWDSVDFSNWSFLTSRTPKIRRVKIKVKKFVYYKLIFRVDVPGARCTVMSVDQTVRYAGKAK